MTELKGALDLLPPLGPPTSKKSWLTLLAERAKAKTKPKADMTTVKKLIKVMEAGGKSVTGVTLAPDGTINVATSEAKNAHAVASNPWNTELE